MESFLARSQCSIFLSLAWCVRKKAASLLQEGSILYANAITIIIIFILEGYEKRKKNLPSLLETFGARRIEESYDGTHLLAQILTFFHVTAIYLSLGLHQSKWTVFICFWILPLFFTITEMSGCFKCVWISRVFQWLFEINGFFCQNQQKLQLFSDF